MSREVSLEDLNSLSNQLSNRINDLSLKINETSTDLKHVQENTGKIHEQAEQISKLFTKIALIEKDLVNLKESMNFCKVSNCTQFKEENASLAQISEKYQELQGQLNQLSLVVERRENEIKEKKTSFYEHLIYPIIVGVALVILGYFITNMITNSINQNLPQQKIEDVHSH